MLRKTKEKKNGRMNILEYNKAAPSSSQRFGSSFLLALHSLGCLLLVFLQHWSPHSHTQPLSFPVFRSPPSVLHVGEGSMARTDWQLCYCRIPPIVLEPDYKTVILGSDQTLSREFQPLNWRESHSPGVFRGELQASLSRCRWETQPLKITIRDAAKSSKWILRFSKPWSIMCFGRAKKRVKMCFFIVGFGELDRPGLGSQLCPSLFCVFGQIT